MAALPPKNQIPSDWLDKNADRLAQIFAPWRESFDAGRLSGAELVAIFLLVCNRSWRGKLWLAGRADFQSPTGEGDFSTPPSEVTFENLARGFDFGEKAQGDVMAFLAKWRLRGVSLRTQRALLKWHAGQYPIRLRFDVPKANELLHTQVLGERIVSLFLDNERLRIRTLERDAFTFALHDLEHADEFFHDPLRRDEQIRFYNQLKRALDAGLLNGFLNRDPRFASDWEYLISDMNSHPAHLTATFKAALFNSQKRLLALGRAARLPAAEETRLENLCREVFGGC